MEITEQLDNIGKQLNEAKAKIDRALAYCPPFLKTLTHHRPALALYHANAKGTGCAAKFTLHPAHDDFDGCIELTAAPQKTVGNYTGENPILPTFDWENAITVKLDFIDLCVMLQVFRGEIEDINNGRGLYHRTAATATIIRLRHVVDPVCGYSLELSTATPGATEDAERRANIFLNNAEALGLSCAIESSMGRLAFGD